MRGISLVCLWLVACGDVDVSPAPLLCEATCRAPAQCADFDGEVICAEPCREDCTCCTTRPDELCAPDWFCEAHPEPAFDWHAEES